MSRKPKCHRSTHKNSGFELYEPHTNLSSTTGFYSGYPSYRLTMVPFPSKDGVQLVNLKSILCKWIPHSGPVTEPPVSSEGTFEDVSEPSKHEQRWTSRY